MTRIAILGTGLIGSSIGLGLKASNRLKDVEVIGHVLRKECAALFA